MDAPVPRKRTVGEVLVSVRPSLFQFQLGPACSPTIDVTWASGCLVVSTKTAYGASSEDSSLQVTPSIEEWACFWNAVDFLDVWSWKADYSDLACRDGQSWSLSLKRGKKRSVTTEGVNGYPAFDSPSRTSENEERFGIFLLALAQLLSRRTGTNFLESAIVPR